MDETGNIMDERKLYHDNKIKLSNYFSKYKNDTSVSIEATRNWYWFVDLLQELNLNVKLVHPKKTRIIAENTIKTDKIDARILSHLDRCNFLPQAYIANKETRSSRELLRYYISLVKMQTTIKNKIHAILAKHNIQHQFSDLFGKSGILFLKTLQLPPIFQMELKSYMQLLENIRTHINNAKSKIKQLCYSSAYAQLLVSVPGIANMSALLLASEIADINRFKSYKKFCCYAGLVSSTHQSAETIYHGRIIKDSNKYIRYVLIEAVPKAIKKDYKLYCFYKAIKRKKGNVKAKIAVARKLAIAIFFMLKNNTTYHISNNDNAIIEVNPKS